MRQILYVFHVKGDSFRVKNKLEKEVNRPIVDYFYIIANKN
jgi:hypothetical protein